MNQAVLEAPAEAALSLEPKTVAEWKPWALKKAQVLSRSPHTRGWTAGHRLIDVYKDTAIIVPPNHGKSAAVPLDSIKLWKKGNAVIEQHEQARLDRDPTKGGRNPGTTAPPTESDWVIYCPESRGFLGVHNGRRGLFATFAEADRYRNRESAGACVYKFKRHYTGASFLNYVCHPYGVPEARGLLLPKPEPTEPEEVRLETPPLETKAAETAETQLLEVAPAVAPEPVAQKPQDEPKPEKAPVEPRALSVPLVAPLAVLDASPSRLTIREAFEALRRTRADELAAEEMVLQAKAQRLRAEMDLDMERLARQLGIVHS